MIPALLIEAFTKGVEMAFFFHAESGEEVLNDGLGMFFLYRYVMLYMYGYVMLYVYINLSLSLSLSLVRILHPMHVLHTYLYRHIYMPTTFGLN